MDSKAIRAALVAVMVFSVFVAATLPLPASASATADNLSVGDASGYKNTNVLVPVNITNVHSESIVGIEFEFLYDNSVINLAEIQKGALISQWSDPAKKGTEGDYVIGIVGAVSEAITNGSTGSVLVLNFSVIGESSETSRMNLTNIKLVNTTFNSGTAPTKNGTFTILTPTPPPLSLGEAVDNSALSWITGGNADWFGQTSTYYYGEDAAQSGAISHNQNSWIQTTVSGPGTLSFYWKVSSERNYDFLEFYIDDVRQDRISGNVDWQYKTYTISSGSHTLKWKYRKDVSINSGSDCGWLDKVEFSATSDLVGLWHFDEGSGTAAVDSSEYGNDGTIYGAIWTTGKLGSALKFDGTDDYVNCGNDPSLNITDKITIMLWIKPAVAGEGGPNAAPVCKAESGIDWSWQLRYNAPGGGNYMGFQFNGDPEGSTWVSVKQNLSAGKWYHIAGTFDGTDIKCYLNGVAKDTNTISAIKGGSSTLFIGQDGWANIFNGVIDEVKIYNRALSAEEIKADYEVGSDTTPPTITAHSPTGSKVSVDTNITVTFSEAMNTTSVESAFSVSPSVSGSFGWNGNEMIFDPDSDLSYETTYTVTVSTEAEDLAGNNLESPDQWQFTTTIAETNPVGLWHFDEGEGTEAADSSGNSNHGTLTNMDPATDWVDGKIGSALNFDGVDDYVEVPDSASLDITDSLTIEAWINPDSVSGYNAIIDKPGSYVFASDNDELILWLYPGGRNSYGLILETGVWQHVAITFDGNNLRFYKNGTSYTPSDWTHSISSSNNPVRIGTDYWNEFFDGTIDEVRIYNRTLSAEEIMAHYRKV